MTDSDSQPQVWARGDVYDAYMGRWSRPIAREFVSWLGMRNDKRWLDVGCGTGALTQTILDVAVPQAIVGVDSSEEYVQYAREHVSDPRASFRVADAQALSGERSGHEAVVSGLVLNFVPAPERMVMEMARACLLNGRVGLYIWDYSGGMEMLRYIWAAAVALDPAARELDEGVRFGKFNAKWLWSAFLDANLNDVMTRVIQAPMHFENFDDFWTPLLGGHLPVPGYVMSLSEEKRAALRDKLQATLPVKRDGSIDLTARAWAVKGTR